MLQVCYEQRIFIFIFVSNLYFIAEYETAVNLQRVKSTTGFAGNGKI